MFLSAFFFYFVGIVIIAHSVKSKVLDSNPALPHLEISKPSLKAVQGSTKKLVIDHDGGADDALAITMSLLNEKYFNGPKLVALTTTHGNVNLTQAIINSDRILALCDRRDIPIYSGANRSLISNPESDHFFGYDGLGDDGYKPSEPIKIQDKPAAVALLELSKKYEGELIIVAIGPMTNIALAASLDPNFIGRLAQLYVGGGQVYSETDSMPQFNAKMDPEAWRILADSANLDKVTFVALTETYLTLLVSISWRKNVLGKIETPLMRALNGFERISSSEKVAWLILDPAVAAIALNNDLVDEFRNIKNDIILEGDQRGINTIDFSSANPNGRLVCAANVTKYRQFLLDVYSAELKN